MPKDYFQFDNMTPLSAIPKGGSIYLIGISGVAMGQLAVALKSLGYAVSGSDKEFYEPMGSFLRSAGLTLFKGYDAKNLNTDTDLIVIGNAISYGHPEVDVVEQNDLPYTCFPRLLYETIIQGKHSIVASGTHGKSTTSAMIAHTLRELDGDPSYFIGGVVESLPSSLHRGQGDFCVVEGDEYDDVFFSKRAKFLHYKPDTCIINAIEFDHADLYEDVEQIASTFDKMVNSMPETGKVICCIDFPEVKKRLESWKKTAKCSFITFGEAKEADYKIISIEAKGLSQVLNVITHDNKNIGITLKVPGVFNGRNALATYIAAVTNGLSETKVIKALAEFSPVKRRQQVRYEDDSVLLIEDFAHHPTAVNETLKALRAGYPDRNICAVFEPRSNTSRRLVFKDAYINAFSYANTCILCQVTARAIDSGVDLLDVGELAKEITDSGVECLALPDANAIAEHIKSARKPGDIVLIMSNGSFGGLIDILVDSFKSNAD